MELGEFTEIKIAALYAVFTGLIWVPIILNRLREMGVWTALRNPQPDVRPKAQWAYRVVRAHENAIENLVVFAPLAIIVHVLGLGDQLTALWSMVFLGARVAHLILYGAGVPFFRTVAFFIGFLAQLVLAARIFGMV